MSILAERMAIAEAWLNPPGAGRGRSESPKGDRSEGSLLDLFRSYFSSSGSDSGSSVATRSPSPSVTEQYRGECEVTIGRYMAQQETLGLRFGEQLQARLVEGLAEERDRGVVPQFRKDVLRRSVQIRFLVTGTEFVPTDGVGQVEAGARFLTVSLDDPRWEPVAQALCSQTSANETGLNAMLGGLRGLSGIPPYWDIDFRTHQYVIDVGTPVISIRPERGEAGIESLSVLCEVISPVIKKDTFEDAVIEKCGFSLQFQASFSVSLDAEGAPVVSDLRFSAEMV